MLGMRITTPDTVIFINLLYNIRFFFQYQNQNFLFSITIMTDT